MTVARRRVPLAVGVSFNRQRPRLIGALHLGGAQRRETREPDCAAAAVGHHGKM
jgi:hypothetical protein